MGIVTEFSIKILVPGSSIVSLLFFNVKILVTIFMYSFCVCIWEYRKQTPIFFFLTNNC